MKNKFAQSLISNYCGQEESDEQTNESQLAQSRKTILKLHRGHKQLEDPQPQMPINHQLSQNQRTNIQNDDAKIQNYKTEQCLPDYWQLQNSAHLYKSKWFPQKSSLYVKKQLVKQIISQTLQSLQHSISEMYQQYSILISSLFLKITHLQEQIFLLPIKCATKNKITQNRFFEKEHFYLQEISMLKRQICQLQQKEKIWNLQKHSDLKTVSTKQVPLKRKQLIQQVENQYNQGSLLEGIEQQLESSNLKVSACHRVHIDSSGIGASMFPVTISKNQHQQRPTVRKSIDVSPLRVHSQGDLLSIDNNKNPHGLSSAYLHSEDVMIVDEQILSELSSSELEDDNYHDRQKNHRCLEQDGQKKDTLSKADIISPCYEQSQVEQFSQSTILVQHPQNIFNQHSSNSSNQNPSHSYRHSICHHKFYSSTPQRKQIQSMIDIPQLQSGYAFTGQEKYLLEEIQQLRKLMTNNHHSQSQPQYHYATTNKKPHQIHQNLKYSLKYQLNTDPSHLPNNFIKSTSKKIPSHKTVFKNEDPKQQKHINISQPTKIISSLSQKLQGSIKREQYLCSVLMHLRQQLSAMKKELNSSFMPCQYCGLRDSLMEII